MTFQYQENKKMQTSTHYSKTAIKCKYCGHTITFYKKKDGKFIPVDCKYDSENSVYVSYGCYGMNKGMVMKHKCGDIRE